MNDLFLKALHCQNSARAPVWFMRQAGRYMPEYRKFREKYSFLEMIHHPEIAAQITLLPIQLLEVDAAILFSDILVIPEILGVGLRFDEGLGPIIERPLTNLADINALPIPCVPEALNYIKEIISLLRPQLQVPLIGFCGAPFTIASYLIEGKSSNDMRKTKRWMLQEPESFEKLLDLITSLTIDYLHLQIAAGAEAIQIFDSWANRLSYRQFNRYSLAYLKKIVDGIASTRIPTILFCRGSSVFASELASIKPSCVSLDWNADLIKIRQTVPHQVAIQGNLDPDILYAPSPVIAREAKEMLTAMHGQPGYIFNLGHGILPDTPFDNVRFLVDFVKNFKMINK